MRQPQPLPRVHDYVQDLEPPEPPRHLQVNLAEHVRLQGGLDRVHIYFA
jgi:hypothetical protein